MTISAQNITAVYQYLVRISTGSKALCSFKSIGQALNITKEQAVLALDTLVGMKQIKYEALKLIDHANYTIHIEIV